MPEINIAIQHKEEPRTYKFIRTEIAHLRGVSSKNVTTAILEFSFARKMKGVNFFSVRFLEYSQSNTEGMFGMVKDIKPLTDHMIMTITDTGYIDTIVNREEILDVWYDLKKELHHKYKAESFVKGFLSMMSELLLDEKRWAMTFRYIAPYLQFFPGFTGKKFTKDSEHKGKRELSNFLGIKTIPVLTKEMLKTYKRVDRSFEIMVTGEIDRENLDEDKMRDFVRTMRNHPRVLTELKLMYTERYAYDHYHWPTQAMCMYKLGVPSFMQREEQIFLKQVTNG